MGTKYIAVSVALFVIVGAGAFWGGTIYEKGHLSQLGSVRMNGVNGGNYPTRQFGQNTPGGTQGASRYNRSGSNGDFAAGEIIAQDDTSVTVKLRDGSTKIVYFSDSTSIGKSTQGTPDDLEMGQQVTVGGKLNPDGSLAAENIQIRPNEQQVLMPQ